MPQNFEFGLDTFGDITIGPDGQMRSHGQVIRDVIDEAKAGWPSAATEDVRKPFILGSV